MSGTGSCVVCKVVCLLVTIGAINWGLVGLFQIDLVARVFGDMTTASRAVYSLIGLAGLLSIGAWLKLCPCQKGSCAT